MAIHLADETALLNQARVGDREAFGLLVQQYYQNIFQLAFRITRNREDAEDALQEAVLKAQCNLGKFQGNYASPRGLPESQSMRRSSGCDRGEPSAKCHWTNCPGLTECDGLRWRLAPKFAIRKDAMPKWSLMSGLERRSTVWVRT